MPKEQFGVNYSVIWLLLQGKSITITQRKSTFSNVMWHQLRIMVHESFVKVIQYYRN